MNIEQSLVRKKLKVLLEKDELVHRYLEQYGTVVNIKHIKAIKSGKNAGNQAAAVSEGGGQDPVFTIAVRCPVCQQARIKCHELKAKSQKITFDRFVTPVYSGAPGFQTVDYSRVSVTVCPRCLFASPDKKDFITYSVTARTEVKPQMGPMVINRLKEEIPARKDMVNHIADIPEYFSTPRDTDSVVTSYKLAIKRALIEAELERPNAYYKAGAYALRIALILREEKLPEEDALREALKHLSRCFSSSNVPSQDLENQVIYIISALHMRLGDDKQARAFINVLEKIKADLKQQKKTDPSIKTVSVETWLNKAKDLWEDRELPGVWDR